jgi:leukotriene-A4 hydrolase
VTTKTTAVQWLAASQTVGKRYPFLFTQLQPIHARSLFPCQDTPSVKSPYDATVVVPLGMTAVMSALVKEQSEQIFTFEQPIPIPVMTGSSSCDDSICLGVLGGIGCRGTYFERIGYP